MTAKRCRNSNSGRKKKRTMPERFGSAIRKVHYSDGHGPLFLKSVIVLRATRRTSTNQFNQLNLVCQPNTNR